MTTAAIDTVSVSVLMPVRNGARWLDEAVTSVLTQSWTDLELVVVDDASVDATPELLRAWCDRDSRVRVLRRPEATGAVAARSDAVAAARGSLLAMLDSDDVSAPERLRRQVAEMTARPALVLLGTGARYIDAEGRVLLTERAAAGRDVGVRLLDANLFFHPSVMVRADAYAAVGGYRPLLEPAEDYDLWLRLAEHGEVDNLPDALIDYRLHDAQVSLRQLEQQATAAAAAAWAAERPAAGAPDPLSDLLEARAAGSRPRRR